LSNKNSNNFTLTEIFKEDFPKQLEKWIQDPLRNIEYSKSSHLTQAVVLWIKMFQQTKDPDYIGQAVQIMPDLLEHPIIRYQVISWIKECDIMSEASSIKESRVNIEKFTKALIPKATKGKKKLIGNNPNLHENSYNEYIKIVYPDILNRIKTGFHNYKKSEERKKSLGINILPNKLFEADRAVVLKKIFSGAHEYRIKKRIVDIKTKGTFNNYLEELAKNKKPTIIALKFFQDFLHAYFGLKIGEKKLRKLIKPIPQVAR